MQKEQAFTLIKRRSLFNLLPRELSLEVLDHCEILEAASGISLNDHDQVQDLHILVSGEIELYNNTSNKLEDNLVAGRSIELDTLFLKEDKWKYLWRTKTKVEYLKINFKKFISILSDNSLLLKYLEKMSTSSEIYKFKRDLKLLNIDDSILQKIVVSMNYFQGAEDQLQDFIGSLKAKTLIIIKSGSIRTFFDQQENKILLEEFFHSDYFFINPGSELEFKATQNTTFWFIDLELLHLANHHEWSMLDFLQDKVDNLKRDQELDQQFEDIEYDDVEPDDDRFDVADFKPGVAALKKNHGKKHIWLQQHDMMDCGAACLAMIGKFYGKNINLATWRSLVHITREGASMLSLKKAAEQVGFDSIGVMSGYKALQELQVPLIALMEYHFVVVYKVDNDFVTIADPANQLKKIPKEEFLRQFSNNALLLKPNEKLKKFPNSKNTFLKYLELFRGEKLAIGEILAISLVIFFLGLALPLFLQFVFDNVLVTLDEKFLRFIAILFLGLGIASATSEWIRSVLVAKLTSKLDCKFTSLFLNHTFKLPFNYFAVRNVGDITTRLQEIGKVREYFSSKLVVTFLNIFAFIIYTSILLLYKKELVLILIPFVVIFMILLYQIIIKVRSNLHDTFKAAGKNQSIVFEQMKSFETIKSLGAEISARLRYEEGMFNLLKLRKKFEYILNFLQSFADFFQEIVSLSLFITAIYFYFKGSLTLGQVMAIQALASSITSPLIQLMQDWDEINKVGVSMEKVDEIMTSKIEPISFREYTIDNKKDSLLGDIKFNDVFFQYGNEHSPMVLKKINITIPVGKVVAFVGGSGSGKTTLAYMINRLYTPTKGKVLIGDTDTEEVPLENLRSQISMIGQDNNLFAGTFFSNITLGDSNPDFERAVLCAKLAHAHNFIMEKSSGYYHNLGEGGVGISGGQKQRINIARALYRDPNILIMDEATSALDAKSEKIIVDNLKLRSKNKTTIIIAHRLNTIMHADYIYVFDKGIHVETGAHKELLSAHGKYYQMFKKQLELE